MAEVTISRGMVVWENGKLNTTNGHGKFIPRKCFGPPYDVIAQRDIVNNPANRKCVNRVYVLMIVFFFFF